MLGREATCDYGVSPSVVISFVWVFGEEVMDVYVLALMQLQELDDLVGLGLQALELYLFGGEHQLTAEAPGCSLTGTMHQFVWTWVLSLVTILQLFCYLIP